VLAQGTHQTLEGPRGDRVEHGTPRQPEAAVGG
jgi:hypothetical protein